MEHNFKEYLADRLLSVDYEDMRSEVDSVVEDMIDDIEENAYDNIDWDNSLILDSEEREELTKLLTKFVENHYEEAVKIVDETNENAREDETERAEAQKGEY